MKKSYILISSVLALALICFIVGSFTDLALSNAIYSSRNGFGIFASVIGTIPGYGILAICGGGLFSLFLSKKEYKMIYRLLILGTGLVAFALAVFFSGREVYSVNGYNNEKLNILGFIYILPIMCLLAFLGYKMTKNSDNPRILIIIIIMMVAIFFALIPGVTAIKAIFHRPRFRAVMSYNDVDFHSWWQRCSNYKDLLEQYKDSGLVKEEFKSFPSGHAGASSVFLLFALFLPFFNKKYEKLVLPVFFSGLAWVLLISFTRILVGAHYLSDVSMGIILTTTFTLIGLIFANKFNKPKQETVVNE